MLEVQNIDVFYGDLQVLWDVSFEVEEGEIVALVGANGSGKSTTLKTLSGLLNPVNGSIRFLDQRLDKIPASCPCAGRPPALSGDVGPGEFDYGLP